MERFCFTTTTQRARRNFYLTWGMRWMIFLLLGCVSVVVTAQVNRAWVKDTNNVQLHVVEGDTSFFVKVGKRENTWYLFYDSLLMKKAAYVKYEKYSLSDSTWFRNGNLKSWSTQLPNCGNCWNSREWNQEGKLLIQTDYANDTLTTIHYYTSGVVSKRNIHYLDTIHPRTMVWHYSVEYYENGQRKYDPVDPNLREPEAYTEYYESGQKKLETTLLEHTYLGSYTFWYSNGQIKIRGQYIDGGLSQFGFPKSNMDGTWSYYNESGKLIKEEFYEEGKLVKTVEY